MNLRVGVNLAKQMDKLVKHKRTPYYTYKYVDDGNGNPKIISQYCCSNDQKKININKTDYYVYAAAGILGTLAVLGYAATKGGSKKKHLLW